MGEYKGKGHYFGYDALSPTTTGPHFECLDCGAIVLNPQLHDHSHPLGNSHAHATDEERLADIINDHQMHGGTSYVGQADNVTWLIDRVQALTAERDTWRTKVTG